jgi:hypothetical protein
MGVKFFYQYLFGIAVTWYRFTQRLTWLIFPVSRLPVFSTHVAIAEHLDWGREYKTDPLKGRLDALTHPAALEHRIIRSKKIGDCDDHAAYRISAMLRGGLCAEAWLGCVWYVQRDGTTAGHALAVWRDKEGQRWWADYGKPKEAGDLPWTWPVRVMEAGYGKRPLCAAVVRIVATDVKGGLKFGQHSSHVFPEDMPDSAPPSVW